jgi:hypothetical protein
VGSWDRPACPKDLLLQRVDGVCGVEPDLLTRCDGLFTADVDGERVGDCFEAHEHFGTSGCVREAVDLTRERVGAGQFVRLENQIIWQEQQDCGPPAIGGGSDADASKTLGEATKSAANRVGGRRMISSSGP